MKNPVITEEIAKRAFLVGIRDDKTSAAEAELMLRELAGLADTLGLEIIFREIIRLRGNNAKYGIGTGKAEELAQKAASLTADCIVFDRDISPSQQRNWEELTGLPAIDRQELIIQIFASRARTKEAELQISLAEHIHALPRLQHKYIDLSQQRGGRYGTRGSGETHFETDRRRLEQKIHRLKDEIEKVKLQRQVQRKQRERRSIPICALVGYTNSGKSTILNALTGAGVMAEDKLFATLDPTTRRLELGVHKSEKAESPYERKYVLMVDTVGFIRRLPHSLVDAFRSTLEEVSHADLLLNILDASDQDLPGQLETTLSVLRDLNADNIPRVTVLNKIDKLDGTLESLLKLYPESVPVSATGGQTGSPQGLEELRERIEQTLMGAKKRLI